MIFSKVEKLFFKSFSASELSSQLTSQIITMTDNATDLLYYDISSPSSAIKNCLEDNNTLELSSNNGEYVIQIDLSGRRFSLDALNDDIFKYLQSDKSAEICQLSVSVVDVSRILDSEGQKLCDILNQPNSLSFLIGLDIVTSKSIESGTISFDDIIKEMRESEQLAQFTDAIKSIVESIASEFEISEKTQILVVVEKILLSISSGHQSSEDIKCSQLFTSLLKTLFRRLHYTPIEFVEIQTENGRIVIAPPQPIAKSYKIFKLTM